MPTYARLKTKKHLLTGLDPDDFIRQQIEQGKSKIEIARMLECNPNSVQVRLRKMGYSWDDTTQRWVCRAK